MIYHKASKTVLGKDLPFTKLVRLLRSEPAVPIILPGSSSKKMYRRASIGRR